MENLQDDTARRIIEMATPLFADKGYAGVSVREIILRKHLKNAHRLADAINQRESSPVKKLELIFAAIGETYQTSPYTIKLLFTEINQPSEFFAEIDAEVKTAPESMTLVLFSIAHFVFIMPNFAKNLLAGKTFDEYLKQAQEIFFRGIMR